MLFFCANPARKIIWRSDYILKRRSYSNDSIDEWGEELDDEEIEQILVDGRLKISWPSAHPID